MTNTSSATLDGPGCGQETHTPECLCDVIIDEIAPVLDDEEIMGTMWAEAVLRNIPDARFDAVTFFEALVKAKDTHAEVMKKYPLGNSKTAEIHLWLQQGESIVDYPQHADVTWDETLRAVTGGQPSDVWAWGPDEWLCAEAIMHDLNDGVNASPGRVRKAFTERHMPIGEKRAMSFMWYYWGVPVGWPAKKPRPASPALAAWSV